MCIFKTHVCVFLSESACEDVSVIVNVSVNVLFIKHFALVCYKVINGVPAATREKARTHTPIHITHTHTHTRTHK